MSGVSIMSRLGSALSGGLLSGDGPRTLTRYMGGYQRENIPYISGYWQFVLQVPEIIYSDHAKIKSINNVQRWFLSTAEGFTPHSRNLNKADVPGQGGLGASFPTGQAVTRTFSTTHREYKNLTMLKLINVWSGIFDTHVGVSELSGNEWVSKSFKGLAYAIITKPVGVNQKELLVTDLEEVFLYDGVWPESSPYDSMNQDIASNDSTQLSVTWNFDGSPLSLSDGIGEQAVNILNKVAVGGYAATWDGIKNSLDHSSKANV